MADKCPKCGIEGQWWNDRHHGLIVDEHGGGEYFHVPDKPRCLVRQLAAKDTRIAELEAVVEEAFSVCTDGVASYSLIPNARLASLATRIRFIVTREAAQQAQKEPTDDK